MSTPVYFRGNSTGRLLIWKSTVQEFRMDSWSVNSLEFMFTVRCLFSVRRVWRGHALCLDAEEDERRAEKGRGFTVSGADRVNIMWTWSSFDTGDMCAHVSGVSEQHKDTHSRSQRVRKVNQAAACSLARSLRLSPLPLPFSGQLLW